MSRLPPRVTLLASSFVALTSASACVTGSYGVRSRYTSPESDPTPPLAQPGQLLSAQISRYGDELPPLRGPDARERMVEPSEDQQDRLVLVFADPLDPISLSPFAFAILRGDGRRVRPTRALLGPADEADERRSVTLLGNFGTEAAPPVAVHVIDTIYAESGATLQGLDANITPPSDPDRPVVVERLAPNDTRCPGSAQLIRTTWTDALTHVGPDDLAGVELRLADGQVIHPTDFDDQAVRDGDPPSAGPTDDNVLDLCLDRAEQVVHLHLAAGLFQDLGGRPTAAADVVLP